MIRERVEVILKNNNNMYALFRVYNEAGLYVFPGGGTDGDALEVAASKEVKEEIGHEVNDLRLLDFTHIGPYRSNKKREQTYTGEKTYFFTGTLDSKDTSILNADDDNTPVMWFSKNQVELLLDLPSNQHRLKVFKENT